MSDQSLNTVVIYTVSQCYKTPAVHRCTNILNWQKPWDSESMPLACINNHCWWWRAFLGMSMVSETVIGNTSPACDAQPLHELHLDSDIIVHTATASCIVGCNFPPHLTLFFLCKRWNRDS